MSSAPIPVQENERLIALSNYKILDTLQEKTYDDLVALADEPKDRIAQTLLGCNNP